MMGSPKSEIRSVQPGTTLKEPFAPRCRSSTFGLWTSDLTPQGVKRG